MTIDLSRIQKIIFALIVIVALVVSFLLGNLVQVRSNKPIIEQLYYSLDKTESQLTEYSGVINEQAEENEEKEEMIDNLQGEVKGLNNQVIDLSQELDEVTTKTSDKYPFAVPSSGVVATFAGTYGGNMMGIEHWGVDIWTTLENNGITPDFRGNPVYSVCSGRVANILPDNGAFTVECDDIQGDYHVPETDSVMVYYGHMGHATTKELYFNLGVGQRVQKGELLGYQGNLSSFFPDMRNVHLHLLIYTGRVQPFQETGGPYNPCLYIGGDCSRPGQRFEVVEN
jgi:murein DD-endopeptidase MepM/ murein hydrolase activator NlpD